MHILLNEISSSHSNFTKIISRILHGTNVHYIKRSSAFQGLLLFMVFILLDMIKSGHYSDFWLVQKQPIKFEPNRDRK